MTAGRPTLIAVFIAAYWDLNRVLRALWMPALLAFALFIAAQVAAIVGARLLAQTYLAKMLLHEMIQLGGLVLIVPFLVAIHRFILLGEVTRRYAVTADEVRTRSFVGWLLVLGLVASIPSLVDILTTPTGVVYYSGSTARPSEAARTVPKLLMFAAVMTLFIIGARLMILLPAAAVNARGLGLNNVLADTRGHVGYIASATFYCLLPLLCLFLLLSLLTQFTLPRQPAGLAIYVILKAMIFVAIALAAAVASRVYLALGDRLNQPLPA